MASTTIRISKDDKKKLDELISILSFKTKKKLTQEQLLKELVDLGIKFESNITEQLLSDNEINEIEIEKDSFFNLPTFNLGPNASENIDEIIYK
ncbi:MAG: hypothetical protein ACTSWH_10845 [Promethearchaeota archaeon]